MLKRDSKRLVIDPSVLLGASTTQHPVSSACRVLLQDVLEICHRVVLTDHLRFEWMERPRQRGKQPSRFSLIWLASMRARKKVVRLADCPDATLRERLMELELAENERLAIEEDVHLVEAALATDYIVVSCDDTVKGLLHRSCDRIGVLKQVTWVNPVAERAHTTEWLCEGAEARAAWRLGATETP